MKDPFFAGINWAKLAKKQVDPPTILKKTPTSPDLQRKMAAAHHDDEVAMLFENPEPI